MAKHFNIEGYKDTYSVYFDFEIDRSEIKGQVLTKKEFVCTHELMGYLSYAEEAPTYLLSEDNTLYSNVNN